MSQTLPDIYVDDTAWVDVNTVSGVAVGDKFRITLKTGVWCRLYEGNTPPSLDSKLGEILTDKRNPNNFATIPVGSLKIWALSSQVGRSVRLLVQEVA